MIKVGLIGYGKAGQAVAEVLKEDPRFELVWVAKRNPWPEDQPLPLGLPVFAMSQGDFGEWLDAHPVDALVDFSDADTIYLYGEEVRKRHLTLVSAISAYSDESLAYARSLGEQARVLCSPNITLGINFLILSARMLRGIAPFADVEILEQPGLNIGYLAYNTSKKPFDDVKVRRAVNKAINKKAIIDAVYLSSGVAATNPIPISWIG